MEAEKRKKLYRKQKNKLAKAKKFDKAANKRVKKHLTSDSLLYKKFKEGKISSEEYNKQGAKIERKVYAEGITPSNRSRRNVEGAKESLDPKKVAANKRIKLRASKNPVMKKGLKSGAGYNKVTGTWEEGSKREKLVNKMTQTEAQKKKAVKAKRLDAARRRTAARRKLIKGKTARPMGGGYISGGPSGRNLKKRP